MRPLGKYVFMPSLILHTLIVGEGLVTSDQPAPVPIGIDIRPQKP